jgi:hypothetical protein
MRPVTINIGEDDLKELEEIFKNEPNFQPRARQDYLIVSILKQVLESAKSENEYRLE